MVSVNFYANQRSPWNLPSKTIHSFHKCVKQPARLRYRSWWCCQGAGDIGLLTEAVVAVAHCVVVGVFDRGDVVGYGVGGGDGFAEGVGDRQYCFKTQALAGRSEHM